MSSSCLARATPRLDPEPGCGLPLERDCAASSAQRSHRRHTDPVRYYVCSQSIPAVMRASPVCHAWRIVIPHSRRIAQCDRALKARRRRVPGLEPSRAPGRLARRTGGDRSGSRARRPERGVVTQLTAARPVKAGGPVAVCGPPPTLWIRCRANGNGDNSALLVDR